MYAELLAEADTRANSEEGMVRLVEGLLWNLPPEHPLVEKLRQALRSYVYAKRSRELAFKRGKRTHWWDRPYGTLNVEAAREDAQILAGQLEREIGTEAVRRLKREIGGSLQGLMRRQIR